MISDRLTAEEVMAYFECRTKAALLSQALPADEPDPGLHLYNTHRVGAQSSLEHATHRKLIEFSHLSGLSPTGKTGYLVDSRQTFIDSTELEQHLDKTTRAVSRGSPFLPVAFCPLDRVQPWHTTLLHFAAVAIEHAVGLRPLTGYVCFGQPPKIKSVRLGASQQHASVLQAMSAARKSARPVSLQLNAHCPVCQYRTQCRQQAIDEDNLSLVPSIPPKERRKLEAKGIKTITQLSYTYRPRRKRRARATPRTANALMTNKNDNSLKALAIRTKQVHILNASPVIAEGTPVYFDVEGLPGSETYYLVGMRFPMGTDWIERSYWAGARTDERDIWRQCLATLLGIENPQLIYYGSYESVYLARMKQRYPGTIRDKKRFGAMLDRSWNVLKTIYASLYFPTFTNGLKDIAGHLGFTWSNPSLTGSRAALLRRSWEIEPNDETKQTLIRYNMEDCRALQLVADAIDRFQRELQQGTVATSNVVDVATLQVPFQRTYGPFATNSKDFRHINNAAYWNYQRERVFARSDKRLCPPKPRDRIATRQKPPRPDKVVYTEPKPPTRCPRCRKRRFWKAGCQTQTVIDLVFTRKGARRQIARQRIQRYKCVACRDEMGAPRQKSRIGHKLQGYIIYLMFELRLSTTQIAKHLRDIFGIRITHTSVHEVKGRTAAEFEPLYESILKEIASGPLAHVDETKGAVLGGGHYVWVFTNMSTVGYVYSPGRDPKVLHDVLGRFRGVLVCDFYGAYESMACAQQKCLIHLMRDINDAAIKSPFNEELGAIASQFGELLRAIVETIDRRGLKTRYLRKHRRNVKRFYNALKRAPLIDDTAIALRKRFMKNDGRLFTFLDHDNVPWNNNNAEHALQAFTKLRNVMSTSTAKGTREYAIILSVQQTLKYRNADFLKFLLSESRSIDGLF